VNYDGRPWTSLEIRYMREHRADGAAAIAEALDRSKGAVQQAAHRARISLRRKGCRAGTVLGQPRGVSLKRTIRDDLVSGTVDAAVLDERLRLDAQGRLDLCPSCGRRVATVRLTGFCRKCHLEAQTMHHLDLLAEVEARRERWQARQQLKRARDAATAGGCPLPPELRAKVR
jgi:hypothetical protein